MINLEASLSDMKQHPYRYNKQKWKVLLFLFAALIAAASLLYSNYLVKSLSKSERTKAQVWAISTQSIVSMPDVDDQFISFIYAVRDSLSLPAIITNEENQICVRSADAVDCRCAVDGG